MAHKKTQPSKTNKKILSYFDNPPKNPFKKNQITGFECKVNTIYSFTQEKIII